MSEFGIAVDFGKTRLRVGLMDTQGEIHRVSEVDSRTFTSTADVTHAIVESVNSVTAEIDCPVVGIGIGSTGAVDSAKGVVLSSGSLDYLRDYDIVEQIQQRLNLPTTVVNDVSAAGLGEAIYGNHDNAARIAFVNFGTGVGVTLVSERRLELGAHGSLGLVSALPLPPDGRTVNECVGGKALAPYMGDPFTGENPAEGGDEKAAKAVKERAVETAAVVIGFVAGLCDPHTIAVGGGVWLQNAWFREQVLRRLSAVLGNQTSGLAVPHVVTARLGDRAGLVGAGYLGLEAGQAR